MATANKVTVTAPASTADVTLTLPDCSIDMAQLVADNTDGFIAIPLLNGLTTVARSSWASIQEYWVEVPVRARGTACLIADATVVY